MRRIPNDIFDVDFSECRIDIIRNKLIYSDGYEIHWFPVALGGKLVTFLLFVGYLFLLYNSLGGGNIASSGEGVPNWWLYHPPSNW